MGALSVWLFRSILCLAVNGFQFSITWNSAICGIWYALFSVVCYISSLAAFHQGKISVVTIFLLLGGMILPALYGVIGLSETVSPKGWVAIGVMICALIPSKKKRERAKYHVSFYILCLAVFFSNGLISVITKYHQIMEDAASENEFLIFSSWMIIALSAVTLLFTGRQERGSAFASLRMIPLAAMGMMLGYAVLNAGGNLCSLQAASSLPSSFQFPIVSAGVIVLTAILSSMAFREPVAKDEVRKIGCAIVGIVLYII